MPFKIAESWILARLGKISDIINGFTPLRSNLDFWENGKIAWFTVADIHSQGRRIKRTAQFITNKALGKNSNRILPPKTVLLCCTASVGEYAITEIELTTNQQFNGLVLNGKYINFIDPEFLFIIMPFYKKHLLETAGKTTFNFVSVKKLSNLLIPIPPLNEQKEIVKAIDNIFLLINELW